MLPYIQIGERQFPTYGLMMVIGFAVAIVLAVLFAKRFNIEKEDARNVGLFALVGGITGAKLLAVLLALPEVIRASAAGAGTEAWAMLLNGGFVFWGGFIGGFAAIMFYLRRYKIAVSPVLNLVAGPLAIGHGIGRIGCHLVGCCYGVACEGGVVFQHSPVAPNGVPLFPTQLTEAGFNILLGILLLFLSGKEKMRAKSALIYLYAYPVFRFTLEFFRGDTYRGFLFGLSTSQWISLAVITITTVILILKKKKAAMSNIE